MAAIVARVRAGEPYYAGAAAEMTARGYPRSFFLNWRLPTLAVTEATLPAMWIAQVVLALLGVCAALLVTRQLPSRSVDQRVGILATMLTMLPVWITPGWSVLMHEIWAGQLIALSLALWMPGRWRASVAVGLAAALVRELAGIYLVVMLLAAVAARRWREATSWALAATVLAIALVLHAHAVAPFILQGPSNGWFAFSGVNFVLAAFRANPPALLLPTAPLIMLVSLSIVGLWMWPHPLGKKVAAVVTAYSAVFLCLGRPDNWYWGFLIAPIWPLGLVGIATALAPRRESPRTSI